jgi:hypothetical protein
VETNAQRLDECVDQILEECDRLFHNVELFPSSVDKANFFNEVRSTALEIEAAAAPKTDEKLHEMKKNLESHKEPKEKAYLKRMKPPYVEGLRPWQQWLYDGAPGSGIDLLTPESDAHAIQLISHGGKRLLESRCNETNHCRTLIGNVRGASFQEIDI